MSVTLPLRQLDDLAAHLDVADVERDRVDQEFASGHHTHRPTSNMDPQGEIHDLEHWLERIRGARTDNTRTAVRRTVRPESVDEILDDDLVRAAFQEEASMIHAAGQRVHGFSFESAWCSALRRAGFNATLCRAGSQADVAIAFEQPPPPDNVIGVQLKSNERHLKAQMAGRDYAVKDEIRIPSYASIENPMKEFAARVHDVDPTWGLDEVFDDASPARAARMGAATTYVTTRHMQGYDAILYCETRFTHDQEQHEIAFAMSSIDVRQMRAAMAGAMGYALDEAMPGSQMQVRPTRRDGRITSWSVDFSDDGDPPAPLFRTRIYRDGKINLEQVSRAGSLVRAHEPIITHATIEIGINDADDVPPVIVGQAFDPLGRMAPEVMGLTVEPDDDVAEPATRRDTAHGIGL